MTFGRMDFVGSRRIHHLLVILHCLDGSDSTKQKIICTEGIDDTIMSRSV